MRLTMRQGFKQRTWIAGLILAAWVCIAPAEGMSGSPRKAANLPTIRVRIYNYAHIDRLALHEAKGQAAGIFARSGVHIAWTEYTQNPRMVLVQPEDSDADFFIRILPDSMARRWNYKPGALGESVISPGTHGPLPGGTANVFYDHVKHFSTLWDMFPGEVLGDAMAHELGHLLLGPEHSREGIMKSRWTSRDLELAKLGKLEFSTEQLAALQLATRSLPRNFLTMAAARR